MNLERMNMDEKSRRQEPGAACRTEELVKNCRNQWNYMV